MCRGDLPLGKEMRPEKSSIFMATCLYSTSVQVRKCSFGWLSAKSHTPWPTLFLQFMSAPLSTNTFIVLTLAPYTANKRAVLPLMSAWLTLRWPCSIRYSTMWWCPSAELTCKAVKLLFTSTNGSAPFSSKMRTISKCPIAEARMMG